MLGHLNTQLAQLRRDQIQPALKPEYKPICAIEVPANSQYLFGDDIAKQLKDAGETSKISRSVANTSNKKPNGNWTVQNVDPKLEPVLDPLLDPPPRLSVNVNNMLI